MNGRQFVDTNILVYAHDRSAGDKHERAKALVGDLWRTRSGVVSTQVLQEVCVNVRRKAGRPLDLAATRDLVTDYLSWHVVVNDGDAVLIALELEDRHQISFWDAHHLRRGDRRRRHPVQRRPFAWTDLWDRPGGESLRCGTMRNLNLKKC
jgi:predicted nucleic acid-binding protein